MKLLTDFLEIASLTATSEASGFPVLNCLLADRDILFKAGTFTAPLRVTASFGQTVELNCLWLDNVNFSAFSLKLSNSADGSSPLFEGSFTTGEDDCKARKAFVSFPAVSCSHLILTVAQQELTEDEVPFIGLIKTGLAFEISASEWESEVVTPKGDFLTASGKYREERLGKSRHVFRMTAENRTKEELDSIYAFTWDKGIIWMDLGNPADSWLVSPGQPKKTVRSPLDCDFECVLKEIL